MKTPPYSIFRRLLLTSNLANPAGQEESAMQASIYLRSMTVQKLPAFHFPLLAALLAVIVFAVPAKALNLITNDNFISVSADPWDLYVGSGASATFTNVKGWGRADIIAGGSSRSDISIKQKFREPLVNGYIYTIAFDLRADATKTIDLVVLNSAGTVIGGFYNISATTTATRRTYNYTHTEPDAINASLSFRMGGNTIDASIDNVVFARQGSPSKMLAQNPDGTYSFPTKSVGGKTWNAGTFDFSYAGYNYGEREDFINIPSATQTFSAGYDEDITDKLNAALALLPNGGSVIIPQGTFRIGAGKTNNAVTVNKDNTVIKGAGMGLTTLKVDPTYHVASLNASYSYGVISFTKGNPTNWIYSAQATTATATVPRGARSITVANASSFAVGEHIVIRQIMWQSFVEQYAYNPANSQDKFWRWSNYNTSTPPLPLFSSQDDSFRYYRKILSKSGTNNNTLNLDTPIPHELNPANKTVSVCHLNYSLLHNCGMQDLTFTAAPEAGVDPTWNSIGATIRIGPLENGLFKNVEIASFRSLGFDMPSSVNLSFINCVSSNSISGGDGGIGYAYHISSQNVLFKNCYSKAVSTGFTAAHPTACNVVFKNCRSLDYRNPVPLKVNQQTDDTHMKFSHGILFDNHYSKDAGMFMINRGTLSTDAYETCGWSIVWNCQNEGLDTPIEGTTNSARHNYLCLTPAEFGMVIGAHEGKGPAHLSVRDGYTSFPSSTTGVAVTTDPTNLKTGIRCDRTLYEYTGQPVAESLYDIQFAQRAKLLPIPSTIPSPAKIVNSYTGKALRPYESGVGDNVKIVQYAYDSTWPSQHWTITKLANGYYSIINVYTGKSLRPVNSSTTSGADIVQFGYTSGWQSEEWELIPNGAGYYGIKNRYSGLALRPLNGGTGDNVTIVQEPHDATYDSMKWQIADP